MTKNVHFEFGGVTIYWKKLILVCFLQFWTWSDHFRDIGTNPPEKAGLGENQPHWKTVKCQLLPLIQGYDLKNHTFWNWDTKPMTKRLELEVDHFFKPGTTWKAVHVYIVNPRTDSQLVQQQMTKWARAGWSNWLILWRNKWVASKIDVFLLIVWTAFTAPFLWLPIMRAMRPRGKGGARHPWLPVLFPPNALHYAMYELRRMQVAIWTSQII